METSSGDFSLFFKRVNDKLLGLSGTYVDDIIRVGDQEFHASSSSITDTKFDSKLAQKPPFVFTGLEVNSDRRSNYLGQKGYIMRLKLLPIDAKFDDSRSKRAKLAWIVHSRTDIACAVSMVAQVKISSFSTEDIMLVNKIVKHPPSSRDTKLRYPKLDTESLYLTVYSDSSFNNKENKSQLGYIVLLTDKHQRFQYYTSYLTSQGV